VHRPADDEIVDRAAALRVTDAGLAKAGRPWTVEESLEFVDDVLRVNRNAASVQSSDRGTARTATISALVSFAAPADHRAAAWEPLEPSIPTTIVLVT
jgi:hypothetical protein